MNRPGSWGSTGRGEAAGGEKQGSNSLLELEAQMFACVRAEAASALSVPDPLGTVPAPVADLTVDLGLVSCNRGAVESLPAGHCREREGQGAGPRFLPTFPQALMPWSGPRGPARGALWPRAQL